MMTPPLPLPPPGVLPLVFRPTALFDTLPLMFPLVLAIPVSSNTLSPVYPPLPLGKAPSLVPSQTVQQSATAYGNTL